MVMENIQQRKYVLDQLNWRDEGRQEGRIEGDKIRKRETALRMKRKNYSLEDIRDLTDLPIEEIQIL